MITNVIFDSEFTALRHDSDLISIGLVADDGQEFYAELTDYNKDVDDWIKKNVIDNLNLRFLDGKGYRYYNAKVDTERNRTASYSCKMLGDSNEVSKKLLHWLHQYERVQLVSDVDTYDFMHIVKLLSSSKCALDLPKWINPSCHDINQDIARFYKIDEFEAFDKSREDILKEYNIEITGDKHNALYDAKVQKAIFDIINKGDRL